MKKKNQTQNEEHHELFSIGKNCIALFSILSVSSSKRQEQRAPSLSQTILQKSKGVLFERHNQTRIRY